MKKGNKTEERRGLWVAVTSSSPVLVIYPSSSILKRFVDPVSIPSFYAEGKSCCSLALFFSFYEMVEPIVWGSSLLLTLMVFFVSSLVSLRADFVIDGIFIYIYTHIHFHNLCDISGRLPGTLEEANLSHLQLNLFT